MSVWWQKHPADNTAPSGEPLALKVGTAYFDQRAIPRDGSSREGLLLAMQATDFAPWPRGLRAHISEGPFMMYLLTRYIPFGDLADSMVGLNIGYSYAEAVIWTDAPGPFGLSVPTAPAPANPEGGPFTGRDDIYVSRDQATYAPEFLPEWKRLASGAKEFLACMQRG